MLVNVPLKPMKPADVASALHRVIEERCRLDKRPVAPEAVNGARELMALREKLMRIDKLTPTTGEAAADSFSRYHAELARLERRFDGLGAELGVTFTWKDAFKNKARCTFADLQWERVCALFNAAAAHSYCACMAVPRGAAGGGLKEAARLFQQAAGCLDAAHDLTKAAIWGLSPRWDPSALTLDVRLEMLVALRSLMLAQAQARRRPAALARAPPPSRTPSPSRRGRDADATRTR